MSDKTSSSSSGVGFFGLLTIVFITLKLTEHIDWSWWWVLSPVLIPVAFALAFFAFAGVCWLLMRFSTLNEKPEQKASRLLKEYTKRVTKP